MEIERLRAVVELMIQMGVYPPEQLFNAMFCITVHGRHVYGENGGFVHDLKVYIQKLHDEHRYDPFRQFIMLSYKLLPMSFLKVLLNSTGLGCLFAHPATAFIIKGHYSNDDLMDHVVSKIVRRDIMDVVYNHGKECPMQVLLILMVIRSAYTGDLRWYDTAVSILYRYNISPLGEPWSAFFIGAEDVPLYRGTFGWLQKAHIDVYQRIINGDDPVIERWNGTVRYRFVVYGDVKEGGDVPPSGA